MKIVVLDGHTLNPGDLSWDVLAALGDCTVYDRTPPGLVAERAAGAEVVLTNKTVLGRDLLAALGGLRYVGVLATGYNVVDTAAARERGALTVGLSCNPGAPLSAASAPGRAPGPRARRRRRHPCRTPPRSPR